MQPRKMLVLLGILLPLIGILSCSPKNKREQLVIVSYGGAHQKAQREAYFKPFAEKYGVDVREETWSGDLGVLKAMVESGNVTWDVVDVEGYMVVQGAKQNLYEKIDYSQLPTSELLPEAKNGYGVATCFWSTVLAFDTRKVKTSPRSLDWKTFWDTKDFPGRRSLRRDPVGNLEIALLATGTPPDKIYPIDIDKAFNALDQIKSSIAVWWEAGEQPADLLSNGEVVYSSGWNGRIFNAALQKRPVGLSWNGGILSSDWWVIPRGSKHRDLANKFIAFASQAHNQAEYSKRIPYGPANRKALEQLSPERLRDLPTTQENIKNQVFINNEWWLKNKDKVMDRWRKWLLR